MGTPVCLHHCAFVGQGFALFGRIFHGLVGPGALHASDYIKLTWLPTRLHVL